jgi:hypothetical protein
MIDDEMQMMNSILRAELEKYKAAAEPMKQKVVEIIVNAGARDWLIELCEGDADPMIQDYARLIQQQ